MLECRAIRVNFLFDLPRLTHLCVTRGRGCMPCFDFCSFFVTAEGLHSGRVRHVAQFARTTTTGRAKGKSDQSVRTYANRPTRTSACVCSYCCSFCSLRRNAHPQAARILRPYWTSEPGWDTELQLKNNLASGPLTVTPVLRLASGEEIPLDPVTIPSNVSVSVWVNEGLLKHSPSLLSQPGSYGSVVLRFTSPNPMNLQATAVLSLHGAPITFSVGASPVPQSQPWVDGNKSGSLEGILWQPRDGLKDVLPISNSADKKISGNLSLFDASGKRWSQSLSFAPHQTLRLAPNDLAQQAGLSGSYGGIRLDFPASAPALDAIHFMYDEASNYSVPLEMFGRDPNATLKQRAGSDAKRWTMLAPIDAGLEQPRSRSGVAPGTVLQPMIFIRNTTGKNISAGITLNWRGESAKGQTKLLQLQLAPCHAATSDRRDAEAVRHSRRCALGVGHVDHECVAR